jgi:murein DD-endopeptidase MepM/ murein hydrolase activator NlpD
MTFLRHSKIIAASLLLSACVSHEPSQVPITIMGTQGMGTVDRMSARAGDTPERLAADTQLDIAALLEMNGLTPQQHLTPGQKLSVPTPSEITVIEGDTLGSIGKAFGIEPKAIMEANNLRKPVILYRGQKLQIPRPEKRQDDNATPVVMDAYDSRFDVTDTASANTSTPITTTDSGSSKIHSSASGTIVEEDLAPPPAPSTPAIATPIPDNALAPMTAPDMQVASVPPALEPVQLQKPEPQTLQPPKPITGGTPKFSWPANGSVMSEYGPKSGGRHNDGINIGAPGGTSVRAAAGGEVVYVGDNVAGFGNLILVRHDGGFASAYGHIQNPTVKRGDRVDQGQAIAQVGKSGNVTSPQLHFEIRKGTQAVNPSTYLP